MKRWLNRARDLLFLPGTGRYWANRLRGKVVILVYHRVSVYPVAGFLDQGGVPRIAPEQLRHELGFLAELGVRFLTLADLRAGHYPEADEIGVVVTFDDGFRDSYEQGLAVVESVGGRAVVFQCTQMLEGSDWLPEHRLYRLIFSGVAGSEDEVARALTQHLKIAEGSVTSLRQLIDYALNQVPFALLQGALDDLCPDSQPVDQGLYPDEKLLRSAAAAGHEIGSHGHRHLHRNTLSPELFDSELRQSYDSLSAALGEPPAAFSYPFGASVEGDENACQQYFSQAVSCERQPVLPSTNPYALGRYSWPGVARNSLRMRRWLLSGSI